MQTITTTSDTFYTRTQLPNGLRLITAPMAHTRAVAISIYVGAGSRYETPVESGLSHFIEHMCFKGTEKRPNAQLISEAIDGVGGVLNAATDREYTVYYAKVARPHMALALDVLTELVRTPLYDPIELEKERKVVIEEIAAVADSPGEQVDLMLDALLWPDQPLGWDVGGSEDSMSGITREMLLDYAARQYVPNNMVVSIAGNVEEAEILELLRPSLGQMSAGQFSPWFPARESQTEPRLDLRFKRTEQSHIAIGMPGLSLLDEDRYALDLLCVLFGESMSSRLFMELRERQGLCYDVNSYVSHLLDTGSFSLYAAVDPKNARQAVSALMTELKKLLDGVSHEELDRARELSKGRMLLRMEDSRAVSAWLGGQEILNGEILTPEDVVERLDAVTVDDLRRVASRLVKREHLSLAMVGPHKSEKRFLPLLDL